MAGMLSRDGHCHSFDASANGYVRGEGVCAVVLKSLEEAQHGATYFSVFVGAATFDYQLLKARLNMKKVDSFFGTGNSNSVITGRVSYSFGFVGPCLAVDTACSSSLVAIHLANKALRDGECSMALVTGVSLILQPDLSINFAKAGMLSHDGHCHSFDASTNGYVRGEARCWCSGAEIAGGSAVTSSEMAFHFAVVSSEIGFRFAVASSVDASLCCRFVRAKLRFAVRLLRAKWRFALLSLRVFLAFISCFLTGESNS
jgi:hypothetical protein